jgi:hypothetical protein
MRKAKKYIWYQIEGHDKNRVEQPSAGEEFIQLRRKIKKNSELSCSADALILRAKRINEEEYATTLDADLFRDQCGNDFDRLVVRYSIRQNNPIKVTLPGMSLFSFCLLFIFLYYCRIETQQIHNFIHLLSF